MRMYVSIRHTITDAQKWDQATKNIMAMMQQGRIPQGLKGLMYMPGTDGHRADCVWEASSVDALKAFIERETGSAAKNEYFPINAEAAFGLPTAQAAHAAA
jgi:hypothetical protein